MDPGPEEKDSHSMYKVTREAGKTERKSLGTLSSKGAETSLCPPCLQSLKSGVRKSSTKVTY